MRNYLMIDAAANKNRILYYNRRLQLRKRILTSFFCLFSIMFLAGLFSFKSKANSEKTEYYKYFTSIQIEYGDTLSSISDRYNNIEVADNNDYIEEVISINHLRNDHLVAGDYLVIPYYSTEIK